MTGFAATLRQKRNNGFAGYVISDRVFDATRGRLVCGLESLP